MRRRPWRGGGMPWVQKTRRRCHQRKTWRWPTCHRGNSTRPSRSRARLWSSIEKRSRMTGDRFRAESLLGASLAGQKKYAEAEPLLLEGYAGMATRKDRIAVPDWYYVDLARDWLVELYQAWGKPAKAAEWRKKIQSGKTAS